MDSMRGSGEASGVMGEVFDAKSGEQEKSMEYRDGVVENVREGGEGSREAVMESMPKAVDESMKPVEVGGDGGGTIGVIENQDDSTDLTTRDGEKLEGVWVTAVQNVMSGTKENPRERADRIFLLKKDLIRKRFNREIGGSE